MLIPQSMECLYHQPYHIHTVFDVANGSSAQSILAHFTASDSFGNNLNHKLTIEGNYSLTTQGTYNVNVIIGDWYPSQSVPVTINVGAPPITITITGPDTVDVIKGTSVNTVLALFTAYDNTGRDLTPYLSLTGSYNLNTPGTYNTVVTTTEGGQKPFTIRVDSPVLSNSSGSTSFTLPAGSDEADILKQFQVIESVTGNTLSGYTLTLDPGIDFNTPGAYTTRVKIAGVTPEVENITFFNIDVTIN
jgi:hypothetical protein